MAREIQLYGKMLFICKEQMIYESFQFSNIHTERCKQHWGQY